MALKEIIGVTVTGFILVYTFFFLIPAMKTAYTAEIKGLNMTSTIMQQLKPIADSWFVFLPIIIGLIGGYTFYLYMTRLSPEDYE